MDTDRLEYEIRAAETRAAEADALSLRRQVAIEYGLGEHDVRLLDEVHNDTSMRALAARLAAERSDRPRAPRPDPAQGRPVSDAPWNSTPAQQFGDIMRRAVGR